MTKVRRRPVTKFTPNLRFQIYAGPELGVQFLLLGVDFCFHDFRAIGLLGELFLAKFFEDVNPLGGLHVVDGGEDLAEFEEQTVRLQAALDLGTDGSITISREHLYLGLGLGYLLDNDHVLVSIRSWADRRDSSNRQIPQRS